MPASEETIAAQTAVSTAAPALDYTLDAHKRPIPTTRKATKWKRFMRWAESLALALNLLVLGIVLLKGQAFTGLMLLEYSMLALVCGILGYKAYYEKVRKQRLGFLRIDANGLAYNYYLFTGQKGIRSEAIASIELTFSAAIFTRKDGRKPLRFRIDRYPDDAIRIELKQAIRQLAAYHQIPLKDSGHHLPAAATNLPTP